MVDRYETFVGWRYLFRRRRSRTVVLLTALFGALTAALVACFLLVHFPTGSVMPGLLAFLAVPALLLFVVCLFLNLFSAFTTISITGVCCGVAALSVVLAVTSGFQQQFQEKVLGVNAHVLVMKYGLDFGEYREVEKKIGALPHVVATAPFVFNEMMAAHDQALSGVLVKGVVPGQSERVLDLSGRLESGSMEALTRSAGDPPLPQVLIGKELARKLKVRPGDAMELVSPLASLDPSLWSTGGKAPKSRTVRVGGVFYFGFNDYDQRLVLMGLPEAQALLGAGDVVTGVELRIDDIYKSGEVARAVKTALGEGPYRVMDWRELNHNLFTALLLQKVVLGLILTLIVIVAACSIIATLTMLVVDKTREIAVLKSLGMRSSGVARVFQTAGMTIGVLGTVSGLAVGLAACFLVSRFGYHLDPRVYLIDRLPVTVHPRELVLTAVVTLVICFLATLYPSLRAASLPPVEGLRHE